MLITQQHKYSLKKAFPSSFSSAFLSASKYICNLLSITGHFPRVCRCCLLLQLNDTKCMHIKRNEHFHSGDQKLPPRQFSLSFPGIGIWRLTHKKMMKPKLRYYSKPMHPLVHAGSVSLYLGISHTCTRTRVYDSRNCMQ